MEKFIRQLEFILVKNHQMLVLTQTIFAGCQQEFDIAKVTAFVEERKEVLNETKALVSELNLLEKEVIDRLGIENFSVDALKNKVPQKDLDTLDSLTSEMECVTKTIRTLDEEVIALAKKEQEITRLTLQHFYEEQRSIQAYQPDSQPESLYIDKLK